MDQMWGDTEQIWGDISLFFIVANEQSTTSTEIAMISLDFAELRQVSRGADQRDIDDRRDI